MNHPLRSALFALGFTTLGATIGLTAGALAGPNGAKSRGGPMKFAMALSTLDLRPEQRAMLTKLQEEVQTELQASTKNHGDEVKIFADAILTGTQPDRATLHKRIDEASAARTEMAHKVIDSLLDVYESLDSDQKTALSNLLKARKEQRDNRASPLSHSPQPPVER